MKKLFYLITLSFLSVSLHAQQFNFEFGKTISKFDYKNSEGLRLENLNGNTENHLALGFKQPIKRSDFYYLAGLFYNKYGAISSDYNAGNYYKWEVNYLGFNIGFGYEFLKLDYQRNYRNVNSEEAFTFYIQLNTGAEMLVQGNQTINNQVINLKGVEQFDKPLILGLGSIGVNYYATRTVFVFAQYTGGKSFSVFKSNSGDTEKLNFITHTISLGIGINLPVHK